MRKPSALVAIAVCALTGCGTGPTSRPVTNPVEIGRLARITIPASATGLQSATDHGVSWFSAPDYAVWGRFDIPEGDLPLVLAGTQEENKAKPYPGYSNVTSHTTPEPWWHPEQLRNPQVAEWSLVGPRFSVNLMSGGSEQDGMVTVYFFNFKM